MLKKISRLILFAALSASCSISSLVWAKGKGGHGGGPSWKESEKSGQGGGEAAESEEGFTGGPKHRPEGWDEGKKTGWEGQDSPPGLFKKMGEWVKGGGKGKDSAGKKGKEKGKDKGKDKDKDKGKEKEKGKEKDKDKPRDEGKEEKEKEDQENEDGGD